MKRIAAIITAMLAGLLISGCATAKAAPSEAPVFADVNDRAAHEVTLQREHEKRERAMQAYDERKAREQAAEEAAQAEFDGYYYGPYDDSMNGNLDYLNHGVWSGGYHGNPDGLNSYDGDYDFNGHTETFYASYAEYDGQLWVDDDGFFRDGQGRYVVSSSDYEHGTEIEISQGTAVVMDDGTDPGIVDVHVTWGR